ncbi:MAG: GNAT family N-acetyltransferase [Planctomycetota bacterium]
MGVALRRATREDSAKVAQVIDLAGKSHLERSLFHLMFPGDDAQRLAALEALALAEVRSFCHHTLFHVAEVDGQFAAALSGYDVSDAGTHLLVPALQEVGWNHAAIGALGERLAPCLPCFSAEPPDTWIIESVATLPAFRRRGLVDRLLAEVMAEGRHHGFQRMQISVLIGNTPAQAAYEKAGFRVAETKTDPDFERALGCPGIHCMLRTED